MHGPGSRTIITRSGGFILSVRFLKASDPSKAGPFEFIAEGKKTSNYKWNARTLKVLIDPSKSNLG
ncbi:hypothetical protein FOMPIDRAFT_1025116 [Fomitopsis schrenkii]|uniref:Uncharacterized protein n=1 Tax=Fomitopsis schrenkii TaxID=2126942 RepID=S8F682_FOMSC|nr:hypothetical protein FOMPIDRAFT_1025116 [Fomitopsis schrenkii]